MGARPSLGVRVFEAGLNDLGTGKEESRAVKRRTARLSRRQIRRRARRQRRVFGLLAAAGLLPLPPAQDPDSPLQSPAERRDQLLKALDRELSERRAASASTGLERRNAFERLPYLLRVDALDRALAPFELGRVLYHLAQRRGFKSNRKRVRRDGEDLGEVLEAIGAVDAALAAPAGVSSARAPRTLGEYLLSLDSDAVRIRARWTGRHQYEAEFKAIWAVQVAHHPTVLTEALERRLRRALFHQRPLRSQKHLVGACEFENGQHWTKDGTRYESLRRSRAPMASLLAQRFRLLHRVNDLVVRTPDAPDRDLSVAERRRLADKLQCTDRLTMAKSRAELGLPRGARFTLELGGEKGLLGNEVNAGFLSALGEQWESLTEEQRDELVDDHRGGADAAEKFEAGRGPWEYVKCTPETAHRIAGLQFSDDYCNLSKRALRRLVPLMEQGMRFQAAVKQVYGEHTSETARESLPPVEQAFEDLRNPVVARSLTELRHVVNDVIGLYGKPDRLRIELARDLRASAKARKKMTERIREREEERGSAARELRQQLESQFPGRTPSGSDLLRFELWKECGAVCPYTGHPISFQQLYSSDVDIEHIVPFSRSLDDSFANKTLCFSQFNRSFKHNRTPAEAFAADPGGWEAARERMRRNSIGFDGQRVDGKLGPGVSRAKLQRFLLEGAELDAFLQEFSSTQLNDTRHASVKARQFVARLYGGNLDQGIDPAGRRRVDVGNGSVTAFLRKLHGMDRYLGESGKNRADHRHHAVDAVAIAMTGPTTLKALSDASARAIDVGRLFRGNTPTPWPDFHADLQTAIDRIVVSHRVDQRVRGPLHEETLYGPTRHPETGEPCGDGSATEVVRHLRKPVERLTREELDLIVDPAVRKAVCDALARTEARTPEKAFDPKRVATLPRLPDRVVDGQPRPGPVIRRVRLRRVVSALRFGSGYRERAAANAENHHVELFEVTDRRGKPKWVARVVSLAEAYARKRAGLPIVSRELANGRFLFSLAKNDLIQMRRDDGSTSMLRVKGFSPIGDSGIDLECCNPTDARRSKDVPRAERQAERFQSPQRLMEAGCEKRTVTPTGLMRRSRA
jgi:CRISPR-associated endonuclease Csn1